MLLIGRRIRFAVGKCHFRGEVALMFDVISMVSVSALVSAVINCYSKIHTNKRMSDGLYFVR